VGKLSDGFLNSLSPEDRERAESYFNYPRKTKKKQSPANKLTDEITEYVKSKGGAAARVNVMGVYDAELGKYRTSGSTKGFEDIHCIKPVLVEGKTFGLSVSVEVKIGKDVQSLSQAKRQRAVEAAGGIYFIAKTFEQFKDAWEKI
tara:strand:+ start:37 stop:474 length:438 start_codon:yes stop_codon:yes gene_type:complete